MTDPDDFDYFDGDDDFMPFDEPYEDDNDHQEPPRNQTVLHPDMPSADETKLIRQIKATVQVHPDVEALKKLLLQWDDLHAAQESSTTKVTPTQILTNTQLVIKPIPPVATLEEIANPKTLPHGPIAAETASPGLLPWLHSSPQEHFLNISHHNDLDHMKASDDQAKRVKYLQQRFTRFFMDVTIKLFQNRDRLQPSDFLTLLTLFGQRGGSALVQYRPHRENAYSLLHYAVLVQDPEAMDYLIKLGADCNKIADRGQTPLHYACALPSSACFDLLIAHGADPHQVTSDGYLPLHIAIKHRQQHMIDQLLFTHQSNPHQTPYHSNSNALSEAIIHNNSQAIQSLCHFPDLFRTQASTDEFAILSSERLPLFLALHSLRISESHEDDDVILQKRYPTFDALLQGGCHIQDKDEHRRNLIHHAMSYQNYSLVSYLMSKNMTLDHCNGNDHNVFHLFFKNLPRSSDKSLDFLRMLKPHAHLLDQADKHGYTPIKYLNQSSFRPTEAFLDEILLLLESADLLRSAAQSHLMEFVHQHRHLYVPGFSENIKGTAQALQERRDLLKATATLPSPSTLPAPKRL